MNGMSMSGMDMSGMSMGSSSSMSSTPTSTMNMSGMHMSPSASATGSSSMGGMDMSGMDMGGGSCIMDMTWNWNVVDSCFLSKGWHVKTKGQFAGTCIGVFLWVVFLVYFRKLRTEFDAFIVKNHARRLNRAGNNIDNSTMGLTNAASASNDSAQKGDHSGTPGFAGQTRASSIGSADSSESPNSTNSEKPGRSFGQILLRRNGNNTADVEYLTASGSDPSQLTSTLVRPNIFEQILRALMFGFEYSTVWLLGLILMSYNGYVIISAFLGAFIGFLLLEWDKLQIVADNKTPSPPRCC